MGGLKQSRQTLESGGIRGLLSEAMALTRPEMEAVVYDDGMPVIVRRFAECILQGDVREMAMILDQALGKPVERHMEVTRQVSAIELMSEEEIRSLLALAESEEGGGEDGA